MNNRLSKIAGIFFIILFWVGAAAPGAFAEKKVIATGVAAISGNNISGARQAAIQNALHAAMDQGLMFMDASSVVKNDDLLEKIYTHTRGVITSHKVIDEKQTEDGLFRVKIIATIDTGRLRGRLEELGLIKAMMDYPRMMILPEKKPGNKKAAELVSNRLTRYFTKNKFDVVDGAAKEGSGGFKRSSEILIKYSVHLEPGYSDEILEYAPVTIQAKAVIASTGQVLFSDGKREIGIGNSRESALSNGCARAADQVGASLRDTILDWWANYTANGIPYVVEFSYPDGADRLLLSFQKAIESVTGVVAVSERGTNKGVAEMQVKFKGQTTDLKFGIINALDGKPGFEKLRTVSSRGRYIALSVR